MNARSLRWCPLPVLALALSACGPAATPAEETLSSNASPPAPTATATEVVVPVVTPTIAPAAPMPGLVYVDLDPATGMLGPYLVEADGQSVQLSDKPDPVLSPDRSQLLYSEGGDIWLLDLATEKTRNITRTKDRVERYYQWWPAHPDLIVFFYQSAANPGPGAGYLATIKPDGTNYLLLDEETGSLTPAGLSPDGQSIAYDRGGQPWVYNYSGGNMPIFPKTFPETFSSAVNPAWSPDGRKIAWQLFGLSGSSDGSSAVAILDLDMLTVSLLHRYPILAGGGIGDHQLAWSPDGEWLAAANQAEREADGKISLWVMRPDGGEEYHIGAGVRPVWNPDGTTLVFSTDDGTYAVNAGEWIPFAVTLPKTARVTDWVKL
jgi:WD40 repeat protein